MIKQKIKKIKINFPKDHVITRSKVLKHINKNLNNDYVAWIGHATFLIKLGKKCTVADSKQIQESSFIWFVSKEAIKDFDKRINKKHCLNS